MANVKSGDLVRGDAVLIPAEDRHVYYYATPEHKARLCRNCDIKETKPYKKAADGEKPCPKTKGGE